jgi:hypothetical protein
MSKLKKGTILIGVTPIDTTKPKVVPSVPAGGKLPPITDNDGSSHTQEPVRFNKPRE